MGYAAEAPYDAIHVGAAAPVVPQAVSCIFSVFALFNEN
jgi:protein-L-isoaspartate O-methyltransferase